MSSKKTTISLHIIDEINDIHQLAQYYDLIVAHSKALTNEDIHQDIVNNIFIKLDKYFKKHPDKTINGGFISNTIRNEYRNHLKASYTTKYVELDNQTETNYCESEDDVTDNFIDKINDEIMYDKMYKVMAELSDSERYVIEKRQDTSLRQISIELGISYNIIWNFFDKFRNRVKNQK